MINNEVRLLPCLGYQEICTQVILPQSSHHSTQSGDDSTAILRGSDYTALICGHTPCEGRGQPGKGLPAPIVLAFKARCLPQVTTHFRGTVTCIQFILIFADIVHSKEIAGLLLCTGLHPQCIPKCSPHQDRCWHASKTIVSR